MDAAEIAGFAALLMIALSTSVSAMVPEAALARTAAWTDAEETVEPARLPLLATAPISASAFLPVSSVFMIQRFWKAMR